MSSNTNADGQPSLAELIQARDEFGELHGLRSTVSMTEVPRRRREVSAAT
jgi:hypothetical protein